MSSDYGACYTFVLYEILYSLIPYEQLTVNMRHKKKLSKTKQYLTGFNRLYFKILRKINEMYSV